MTPGEHPLDRLQLWMQAVITHPAGVVRGIESDAARQAIDVRPADLEQVVTRSRSLSATDRLDVYGTAYFARLLECLREEFPALLHALGRELFDEFAVGYLQSYPSRSYTLNHLGAYFPGYLAEVCPTDEDETGWAAFLVDLARLERAYSEVFDGPGSEGQETLTPERLLAIPPDRWPKARLIPAPDLRLIELRSPAHEYIRGVRREESPSVPDPTPTLLAVHRQDYTVRRHALSPPEYAILSGLVAGETVGEAIARAAACADSDDLVRDLQAWFEKWAAERFFRAVEWSGYTPSVQE